jgi:hypothetical protein
VGRIVAEAGLDGVLEDVVDRCREVLVRLDHRGGEAVAEEVATAAVAFVELLSVTAVQAVEAGRELAPRCLDDHVVVRAHEAEGVDPPPKPLDDPREQAEKVPPVVVAREQRGLVYRAACHVVNAVREVSSKWSRHPLDATGEGGSTRPAGRHRDSAVTLFLHCDAAVPATSGV